MIICASATSLIFWDKVTVEQSGYFTLRSLSNVVTAIDVCGFKSDVLFVTSANL